MRGLWTELELRPGMAKLALLHIVRRTMSYFKKTSLPHGSIKTGNLVGSQDDDKDAIKTVWKRDSSGFFCFVSTPMQQAYARMQENNTDETRNAVMYGEDEYDPCWWLGRTPK